MYRNWRRGSIVPSVADPETSERGGPRMAAIFFWPIFTGQGGPWPPWPPWIHYWPCYMIFVLSWLKLLTTAVHLSLISHDFFLKSFWADTCPFWGPLVPLFWISGDVSCRFQSQIGLPYSHCGGKHNVHSPRSTSGATLAGSWCAASPVPTYCCRGEVAGIRTRALRISVSQTLYQLS